jgi:pilus assembly protein CpaF
VNADALTVVRRELREQLRRRVDARGLATAPRTERRLHVREEALALLRERGAILPQRDLARVVNEVSDEVVGFGPIEFLLQEPDVTEVMVNGPDDVFVEREGRIERVPGRLFEGEESVLHLIERIVGSVTGRSTARWRCPHVPTRTRDYFRGSDVGYVIPLGLPSQALRDMQLPPFSLGFPHARPYLVPRITGLGTAFHE